MKYHLPNKISFYKKKINGVVGGIVNNIQKIRAKNLYILQIEKMISENY